VVGVNRIGCRTCILSSFVVDSPTSKLGGLTNV